MSFLDGILGNEKIQKLALGQLKNIFSENREMIVVTLDANGELDIKMFAPGEAAVIIEGKDGVLNVVSGTLPISDYVMLQKSKSNGNT